MASASSSIERHVLGETPQRPSVGGEVHPDQILGSRPVPSGIGQEVVERLSTLADLQTVDHGEPTVVAHQHDHLVTGQHRASTDRCSSSGSSRRRRTRTLAGAAPGRLGHRRSPSAAEFVAHARETVLAIEGADALGPPAVVHLAREAAGRRQADVVLGWRGRSPLVPPGRR